ncbi:MAG: hypothetical protein AAFQ15_04965 [Pseudomonadota bacterium]
MARLFDAYIIVDWSASAKPVTGSNSIWVGVRARDARLKYKFSSTNPRTRLEARGLIAELAEKLIARGDKVLIGFDFAVGYPSGTAEAIGLDTKSAPPWRAMHEHLSAKVTERDDNSNARFALAAGLNYAISKGPHPFWGAPKKNVVSTLSMKKGDFSSGGSLAEHRICEGWIKANFKAHPKSVWQLLGAGSVGSQAMLGIPTVSYLRARIPRSAIWPFETGFQDFSPEALENTDCVFAEIYPSTVPVAPKPGEILDETQVKMLSERLESLDSAGELARAFGPPDSISDGEIHKITTEEGWILAK